MLPFKLLPLFAPAVFQRFQLVMDGLEAVVMTALLDELLQLLHAPLLGLDALVQRLGSAIDRGKCSVQIVKGSDALCLQVDDGAADFLQLRCAVLLLPADRILAASLPFHAQIFRQQRGNVRRAWGGLQFLLFSENLRKPFPQFVDIAPDFPDDAVGLSYHAVDLALVGGNALFLHLGSGNAHVDGGQLVHTARGVTAVVDALRAVVLL